MAKFKKGDVILDTTYNSIFEVIEIVTNDNWHPGLYLLKHLSGPSKGTTFMKIFSIIDKDCVYSKSGSVLYGPKV